MRYIQLRYTQDGKMKYSNAEMLQRTEKAVKNKKKLTHITDKSDLSSEDKIKISLCKHFVQFANSKKMKMKEISELTDIPTTRLSEITNYKIKNFTVDQLIKNLSVLAKHDRPIKAYLNFLEHAAELPTLKVTETNKLTEKLKEASRVNFVHA